jgi:hypothetical protein
MDDNTSCNSSVYYAHDDAYDTTSASYTLTYDYYNHYSYRYKIASLVQLHAQ